MARRFPFKKIAKYPHMKPEDVAVWERFIDDAPEFFDEVEYDVHLGAGREIPPNLPENIARSGKMLTQRKLDVLGHKDDAIYLVEIKPVADTRGLGQIEMYFDLYINEHGDNGNIFKMVLASDVEPDLVQSYRNRDVILTLV